VAVSQLLRTFDIFELFLPETFSSSVYACYAFFLWRCFSRFHVDFRGKCICTALTKYCCKLVKNVFQISFIFFILLQNLNLNFGFHKFFASVFFSWPICNKNCKVFNIRIFICYFHSEIHANSCMWPCSLNKDICDLYTININIKAPPSNKGPLIYHKLELNFISELP